MDIGIIFHNNLVLNTFTAVRIFQPWIPVEHMEKENC